MRCFLRWMLVAAAITSGATAQPPAKEPNTASVEVILTDMFGAAVAGAKVTMASVVPGEQFAAVGGQARFDRVPFGTYDLQIRLVGFVPRIERLEIFQSSLIFRIGVALGYLLLLIESGQLLANRQVDIVGGKQTVEFIVE